MAGKELQMDTKYPFGYKQGKVIYTIIDDATRWVFAWSYSTANDFLLPLRRLELIREQNLLETMSKTF